MKRHVGFVHAFVTLTMIACLAAGYDIYPFVPSAAAPRNDMIDGEILFGATAVLACEPITNEDLAPVEDHAWSRPSHESAQPNNGRDMERATTTVQIMRVLLQHIGLATENEHYCAANVAHIQRLVVLIEY